MANSNTVHTLEFREPEFGDDDGDGEEVCLADCIEIRKFAVEAAKQCHLSIMNMGGYKGVDALLADAHAIENFVFHGFD